MFVHAAEGGQPLRLPDAETLPAEGGAMIFGSDRFEQLAWMLEQPWEGLGPPLSHL